MFCQHEFRERNWGRIKRMQSINIQSNKKNMCIELRLTHLVKTGKIIEKSTAEE